METLTVVWVGVWDVKNVSSQKMILCGAKHRIMQKKKINGKLSEKKVLSFGFGF